MDVVMNNASRVIQLALTPIFLLSAVGSLLGVFTTRLGRISDRVHALKSSGGAHRAELANLRLRSRILDVAVVLASLAGALTCCSAMILFFESLRGSARAALLFWIFGAALLCAILSLTCFGTEVVLGGRTLRDTE